MHENDVNLLCGVFYNEKTTKQSQFHQTYNKQNLAMFYGLYAQKMSGKAFDTGALPSSSALNLSCKRREATLLSKWRGKKLTEQDKYLVYLDAIRDTFHKYSCDSKHTSVVSFCPARRITRGLFSKCEEKTTISETTDVKSTFSQLTSITNK